MDESLHFVIARLAERGSAALAARVATLLRGQRTIERHIMLVQDESRWDDRELERLSEVATRPVHVTMLRLTGPRELVAARGPTRPQRRTSPMVRRHTGDRSTGARSAWPSARRSIGCSNWPPRKPARQDRCATQARTTACRGGVVAVWASWAALWRSLAWCSSSGRPRRRPRPRLHVSTEAVDQHAVRGLEGCQIDRAEQRLAGEEHTGRQRGSPAAWGYARPPTSGPRPRCPARRSGAATSTPTQGRGAPCPWPGPSPRPGSSSGSAAMPSDLGAW